jgi:hypothetical protein
MLRSMASKLMLAARCSIDGACSDYGVATDGRRRPTRHTATITPSLDAGIRWLARAEKRAGVTCLSECSVDQFRIMLTTD